MAQHRTPVPPVYRGLSVIRPLLRAAMRYEVSGLENLPESGGFIVTPNHVTHIDPFPWAHVLYREGIAPVFLAKSSLFEAPGVGWVMRRSGQVRVDRESAAAGSSLSHAVRALEAGRCVAVYPEGSVTRDPELWPMRGKTGAARLALRSGHPVIPIAHWGEQDLLAPYGRMLHLSRHRTRVRIRFGPPIDLADLRAQSLTAATVAQATTRIMQGITHELEQIRGEQAPEERFDPKAHGMPLTGNYRRGEET